MLDEMNMRVMQLAGQGFCCSQIMVMTSLEDMGRDNPDCIRALSGLCNGMGDAQGTCGVFSGATCVMGLYAGKGHNAELEDERLPLLIAELREWFVQQTLEFGGTTCAAVCGNPEGRAEPSRCGPLMGAALSRTREILMENGFDIGEGRE